MSTLVPSSPDDDGDALNQTGESNAGQPPQSAAEPLTGASLPLPPPPEPTALDLEVERIRFSFPPPPEPPSELVLEDMMLSFPPPPPPPVEEVPPNEQYDLGFGAQENYAGMYLHYQSVEFEAGAQFNEPQEQYTEAELQQVENLLRGFLQSMSPEALRDYLNGGNDSYLREYLEGGAQTQWTGEAKTKQSNWRPLMKFAGREVLSETFRVIARSIFED